MSNRTPQFRRYRRVYARVKLNGAWVHLGKYESPAAKAEYKRLILQWASAEPPTLPQHQVASVAEILEGYRRYAEAYYGDVPRGRYRNLLPTLRTVRELYADLPSSRVSWTRRCPTWSPCSAIWSNSN